MPIIGNVNQWSLRERRRMSRDIGCPGGQPPFGGRRRITDGQSGNHDREARQRKCRKELRSNRRIPIKSLLWFHPAPRPVTPSATIMQTHLRSASCHGRTNSAAADTRISPESSRTALAVSSTGDGVSRTRSHSTAIPSAAVALYSSSP